MKLVENELLIKAAQERSVVESVKKKLQDNINEKENEKSVE